MLLCRNPYIAPGTQHAYGCGQCLPCRINKRRMWTHRLMLEARCHPVSSFWTLTYDDANLPLTQGDGEALPTLEPKDLTDFLKRLRKDYHPQKLRYYGVGEYGEQGARPHYHLALFNYPACNRGITQLNRSADCCYVCDHVRRIWGKGIVYSGELSDDSAAYICGYTTKGYTKKGDERLQGRKEEYAVMSRRPGIGATFMPEVASVLLTHNLEKTLSDVPTSLQIGCHVKPLGRYLTRMLRTNIGRTPDAPPSTLAIKEEEMRPLRALAKEIAPPGQYLETLKQTVINHNQGRADALQGRHSIYKKRGSL